MAVVGGGPAGLMAAEVLSRAGQSVTVFDRMATPGRKLLIAGRGGLNLTHGEPLDNFLRRYPAAPPLLVEAIRAFPPQALRQWADGLGAETFIGSSGRVFPRALKASGLLRAWLARLAGSGVRLVTKHRWLGWEQDGALRLENPAGAIECLRPRATLLAMGGASWPRLGSDGSWTAPLGAAGIEVAPLRPANCGFAIAWSEPFRTRFAGEPLKNVALSAGGRSIRGEVTITGYGIEGGALYGLSAWLRDRVSEEGSASLFIDLRPDLAVAELTQRLERARPGDSFSNRLRRAGFPPLAAGLLRESGPLPPTPDGVARRLKALPLRLGRPQPLAQAISTAGGVSWAELDTRFMLHRCPGAFVAGEMIDWEAPTGGYLLQACFATGAAAARGMLAWTQSRDARTASPGAIIDDSHGP